MGARTDNAMLSDGKPDAQDLPLPTQGRPFAGFKDFAACVAANGDKDNPQAYCAAVQNAVEGKASPEDQELLKRSFLNPHHHKPDDTGFGGGQSYEDELADDDQEGDIEALMDEGLLDDNGDDRAKKAAAAPRTIDGTPGSAEALLPLEQHGMKNTDARGLDASIKQEQTDGTRKMDALVAQENVMDPVPGAGLSPMGPGAGPTDATGLQAKEQRQRKRPRERSNVYNVQWRAIDDTALPKGVCGRVTGIAVRYNTIDDYDTMFAPGCLDKTRAERVPAGRVALYEAAEGPYHTYSTRTHVGVVRELKDVGNDVMMTADLFDTDEGRHMKQYLQSVIDAGGFTGLSVGFQPRKSDKRTVMTKDNRSKAVEVFQEVALVEVTVTPVPAVPGTQVMAVRTATAMEQLLRTTLRKLPIERVNAVLVEERIIVAAGQQDTRAVTDQASAATADSADAKGKAVSMKERLWALRETYKRS